MNRITADYHLHSAVSPDCNTPMEESCEAAIALGLTELVFTEHMEFFSDNFKRYSIPYMQEYFDDLARCREKYAGKLSLKAGVEMGQGHRDREWEKTILDRFHFDFVIGSVHKIDNVDMGKMAFADEEEKLRITDQYLDYLWELVDTCDFDSLGHIDLVKRYAANHGLKVDLMDYPDRLRAILKRLAERGLALEINTSGIRQSPKEALPSVAILKMFKEVGGRYLTVGSDAHFAKDVAADFETARQMALEAGFRHIALYEDRKPILVPIDEE
ncbi:MAG: histidinol-phosphatase HisJ family protein [Oscillospiraceae bacterium]|nr:histidinol-phosphatase HisJ family protein [Oscillospiraceae bacterium]MBR2636439.1 histidinol-phosphatase HisJ family protein [Oscillospiraceae bacterium]